MRDILVNTFKARALLYNKHIYIISITDNSNIVEFETGTSSTKDKVCTTELGPF